MKNRFNRLTSKEWLPFQKSWFKYSDKSHLYLENIRFFTAAEKTDNKVLYYGSQPDLFRQLCVDNDLSFGLLDDGSAHDVQFVLIDLLEDINQLTDQGGYAKLRTTILAKLSAIYDKILDRRFIAILAANKQSDDGFFPYSWDLGKTVGTGFSLKDEKIGCMTGESKPSDPDVFMPVQDTFYSLYFRKDENANGQFREGAFDFFKNNTPVKSRHFAVNNIPSWFVLKPQPRKKDEIRHPAKYPEELVEMFVKVFTDEDQNVFDPMSGTGSTQLGALKLERNAYGTELSEFFADIANRRCKEYLTPSQQALFFEEKEQRFLILNKDARKVHSNDFPQIDYMITSPPYWDMLNMKGAENQAKRVKKGLQTNYSDEPDDIGNIESYNDFLQTLTEVYFNIASLMHPGGFMTIVVKNIKKKGSNYPFAWDLSNLLQEKLILLPEVFWCQDDISIAPYGYGNTWVSNTFHQYCLNFQVPANFQR